MDKDENLFDDQIDEDDDLLDISLDELSTDETEGTVNEEPDEDIIELIDLLEKGDDDDLLGMDDDLEGTMDLTAEDINSTGKLSSSDLDLDDLMSDSDISAPDDQTESVSDDDLDLLLSEESLDDLGLELDETDDADDEHEKLLDDAELKSYSSDALADTLVENDEDDIDLQMEGLMNADSGQDEAVLDDAQDDILGDIALEESIEENILSSDDEILDELDNELENSLLLSDDESGEESLLESETAASDDQTETADVNFNEIDDIPLDGESLEELLTESDRDEAGENKFDTIDIGDLTIDDGNLIEAGEDIGESDESSEPIDDLFSETELQESADESGSDPDETLELLADADQIDTADKTADLIRDDKIEDISAADLFSEEGEVSAPVEESVIPDDSMGDSIEKAGPVEDSIISEDIAGDVLEEDSLVEEDLPAASDEGPDDVIDALAMESPEVMETLPSDDSQAVKAPSDAIPQIPVISEERVEEIVRDVVGEVVGEVAREVIGEVVDKVTREVIGEVVGKISREVFSEVAEKVITEAIDSLQKSLESDSE